MSPRASPMETLKMPTDFVAVKLWSVSESRIFIIRGCNLAYFRLAVKIFCPRLLQGVGDICYHAGHVR